MASIIKNQILKHLSRFVKDLSSDRINVSTLKGEGELNDLKLEEEVLTELLALPIWMKITKASCNRARIMIQWTKLKSVPIRLILDHVEIHVEACSELRPVSSTQNVHLNVPAAGKYGFVNKVVDGITVTVESVDIRFFSKAFESKVQISRIRVESRSPQWKKAELTHTRLKDLERGELLLFKEIEWQTLRLEAQSTTERHLAPLRLLTNQARARVVIKKKLNDCSVVGCRLSLILDDLLWVLTDSQILAAAHFVSSLSGLVKQATETSQAVKAARKLESLPEYRAQVNQLQAGATTEKSIPSVFDAFDVKETSYHLVCEKIDLHFCDDAGGGRSDHPDLRDGGAGQVQLTQLMVDFYPYHLSSSNRRHWLKYNTNDLTHWLKESLNTFRSQMMDVLFPRSTSGSGSGASSPLDSTKNVPPSERKFSTSINTESVVSNRLNEQVGKLMSTCLILKIRDIFVYTVTTLSREVPQPFISSYIDRPKDVSAINLECSWFYYPGGMHFPLPSPKMYTQINPLQMHLDVRTILWLNSFLTNLQNCMPPPPIEAQEDYVDIRVEIIMPKIVFDDKKPSSSFKQRPDGLQIQAARVVISNFRSGETGSTFQLKDTLADLGKQRVSADNSFNFPEIPQKFIYHSQGIDKIRERKNSGFHEHLAPDMLWTEARDVWFICVDAVWADFCVDKNKCENDGLRSKRKFRPPTVPSQSEPALLPFIDSLPINLWIYCEEEPLNDGLSSKKRKNIKALLRTDKLVNAQLTHQQYLFLLRAAEAISEISLFLTTDTRKTYTVCRRDDSVELIGCLPRLEISFILPYSVDSNIPRENSSSLGDLESAAAYLEDQNVQANIPATDWNMAPFPSDTAKPSPFDTAFMPASPLANSPTTNSPLPSIDSIKSSLTQGMKQGISSLVVSFSKGGGLNTPDPEVTSMWSTDSSENNFVHLDESPDGESRSPGHRGDADCDDVEVAEEVIEEDSQSSGSFSIHNPYAKEDNMEINVLTVAVDGICLSQQSEGLRSKILLKGNSIAVSEDLHIQWKEFQTIFVTKGKKWRAEMANKALHKTETRHTKVAINVKFSQTVSDTVFRDFLISPDFQEALMQIKKTKNPRVNLIDRPGPESPIRAAINKASLPILQAIIDLRDENHALGLFLTLHDSTLKSAAEFFEDEIPPVVLPMQIYIQGANVEIIEEKVSTTQSTKFALENGIMIKRNNDGIFTIGCPSDPRDVFPTKEKLCNGRDRAELDERGDTKDLKQTIMELRQQVSALQKDKSYLLSQLELEVQQKKIPHK